MEQIEESLSELLEQEADFVRTCSDYLKDKREKPSRLQEYVFGLMAVHNVQFDQVDAQLTQLEKLVG